MVHLVTEQEEIRKMRSGHSRKIMGLIVGKKLVVIRDVHELRLLHKTKVQKGN